MRSSDKILALPGNKLLYFSFFRYTYIQQEISSFYTNLEL